MERRLLFRGLNDKTQIENNSRLYDQTIADSAVREAAEFVQANWFIEALPEG